MSTPKDKSDYHGTKAKVGNVFKPNLNFFLKKKG
jgi:hypothetical protein